MGTSMSSHRATRRRARWAALVLVASVPLLIGPPPALASDDPTGEPDVVGARDQLPEVPPLEELTDAASPVGPAADPPADTTTTEADDETPPTAETAPPVPAPTPPEPGDVAPTADPPADPVALDPGRAAAQVDPSAIAPAAAQVDPSAIAPAAAPVVLVNGAPIDSDGDHRVTGCAVAIDVSGLAATPEAPVPVGITIDAIAPTTPEGTSLQLVADVHQADEATVATTYDMTELLAGLEPKTNGYRLEVAITVAGTSMGETQLWLACGAAQDGTPNRIVFEVVWLDAEGNTFVGPLDEAMPEGWRDGYVIEASSSRGTATCTIPVGDDQLVCTYDNPGHGSAPGLVVPGGKRHTYDVAQVGLPKGWVVDPATVGTFVGRETCGTGGCGGGDGGHDDGGHDDGGCGGHDADGAAAHSEGSAEQVCTHTVVNQQVPPSTTTTTTTTTVAETTTTDVPATTAPSSAPAVAAAGAVAPTPVGPAPTATTRTLPRTGSPLGELTLAALALLVSGAVIRNRGRAIAPARVRSPR